jgi:ankyrin repeat protein
MGNLCTNRSDNTDEAHRPRRSEANIPRISYTPNESYDSYRKPSVSGNLIQKVRKSIVLAAVTKADRPNVLQLLKSGFPIDYKLTEGGWRMIHVAASTGDQDMLELLISRSADVNIPDDEEEWTPLMVATMHSQLLAVQLLVRNGADMLARDISGRTALDLAEQYRFIAIADFLEHEVRLLTIRESTLEPS